MEIKRTDVVEGDIDVIMSAMEYRCGHCHHGPPRVSRGTFGQWLVNVTHADTCPVLAGAVDSVPDVARSIRPQSTRRERCTRRRRGRST